MKRIGRGTPDIEAGEYVETFVPPFIKGTVMDVRDGKYEREVTIMSDYGQPVIVGAKDVSRCERKEAAA